MQVYGVLQNMSTNVAERRQRGVFKTKRQLRKEIRRLENKLDIEKARTKRFATVEKASLRRCKSMACYGCRHIVYLHDQGYGGIFLVGCGRDLSCPDFSPDYTNRLPENLCLDALRKEVQKRDP